MHNLALFPYQFSHEFGCEMYFANQTDNETELSVILIIGRSCNVSQPVANPSSICTQQQLNATPDSCAVRKEQRSDHSENCAV